MRKDSSAPSETCLEERKQAKWHIRTCTSSLLRATSERAAAATLGKCFLAKELGVVVEEEKRLKEGPQDRGSGSVGAPCTERAGNVDDIVSREI